MKLRKLVLCVGILGLFSLSQLFGQEFKRPNIILIMADDHAINAISAYGSTLINTPNIDRIAEEGMLFENCFSTNSICNPSRASIMTGKYSHVHGITTNYISPGNDHVTYPELLKDAGYQTALIGKTHFREETNCIKSLDHYMISHGAEYHDPEFLEKGKNPRVYEGYVTDIVTEKGIDWMKKCDKTKPFMLMLHHPAPHMPFQATSELFELYKNYSYPEPISFTDSSKNKVGWNGHHVNEATRVDLVGHAWFFKKEHLKYMWQEQPLSWENGEDIHLSCMAWKHAGIGTYVPPHPADDESLWSCRPDFGKMVGRTSSATFKSEGHHSVRDDMVNAYRKAGWKIVADEKA